jgi:hypothetical protein
MSLRNGAAVLPVVRGIGIKVKIVVLKEAVLGCMNVLMYQAVFALPMERIILKHCVK